MEYLIASGISFGIAAVISIIWVRGIDNMKKNYPNYKGEDFLDWENAEAPWVDDWHDDKAHTEGEIG